MIEGHLRPFFGDMLARAVTVKHFQAYREFRRSQKNAKGEPIRDTTINRDLSKVSKAFKIGLSLGKVLRMPLGGTDFQKRPEQENTRRVRLPERYYFVFRAALHPALQCLFVVGYNIGRRKQELVSLQWNQIDFEEKCIFFEKTKSGPAVKVPFFNDMEAYLYKQKAIRDSSYPGCPWVFFWFDYRVGTNGEQVLSFQETWDKAVVTLNIKIASDKGEAIDLNFHDLRRSAHYQMRKAKIDPKTRRAFLGHKTGSMDDRYTIIDDESITTAVEDMKAYQHKRGLASEHSELVTQIDALSDAEWERIFEARQRRRTLTA